MKRITAILLVFAIFAVFSLPHDAIAEKTASVTFGKDMLPYVEDEIYNELIDSLAGTDYVVENVEAIYISQEYLEEVAYNTRANIFFGYTLAELDAQFEGTRYVFTLGEDNQTSVIPFEEYIEESVYLKLLKDIADADGVIVIYTNLSLIDVAGFCVLLFISGDDAGKILESGLESVVNGLSALIKTGDLLLGAYNAPLLDDCEISLSAIIGTLINLKMLVS